MSSPVINNRSAILSSSTSIAAFAVEKVAGRVAGAIVQPVVWVLDYSVNDAVPDGVDVSLFGVGAFGGPFGAIGAAFTGLIKGVVNDDTKRKLSEVRASEPTQYRRFVGATVDYSGMSGQTINAMTIASRGGTAWEHSNGLWVYITDARGRLVADYMPTRARRIWQPTLPLKASGDGRYSWHEVY